MSLARDVVLELVGELLGEDVVGVAEGAARGARREVAAHALVGVLRQAICPEHRLAEQAQHLAREIDRVAGLEQQRLAVVLDDLRDRVARGSDDRRLHAMYSSSLVG